MWLVLIRPSSSFQAFDSSVSRDQVIALLREHIQSNTIKVCGSNYTLIHE